MSRILGMLCMRNEMDRYLGRCLSWNQNFVDELFIYDDQSTDASVVNAEASPWEPYVTVRPDDVPAFMEHEGEFRQAAWEEFEFQMQPQPDDWVFAFDADEFIVAPSATVNPLLLLAKELTVCGVPAARLKIHEVFGFDEMSRPLVRTDGYWGEISGIRFFRYKPGGRFANRRLGCGSAPTYAEPTQQVHAVELLHFGYARPEDRVEKHNRYFGLPGHNPSHIASIIGTPTLEPWLGYSPTGPNAPLPNYSAWPA